MYLSKTDATFSWHGVKVTEECTMNFSAEELPKLVHHVIPSSSVRFIQLIAKLNA